MAASVKKKAGVGGKKKDKKKDSRPITVNLNACHYPIIYKVGARSDWFWISALLLRGLCVSRAYIHGHGHGSAYVTRCGACVYTYVCVCVCHAPVRRACTCVGFKSELAVANTAGESINTGKAKTSAANSPH